MQANQSSKYREVPSTPLKGLKYAVHSAPKVANKYESVKAINQSVVHSDRGDLQLAGQDTR